MFQENTGGGALENFQKGLFDNILIIIRKHIDDILIKLDDIWHFILPEQFPSSLAAETLSQQLFLFSNYFIDIFLAGRFFRRTNIRGICFHDFGPKLRN